MSTLGDVTVESHETTPDGTSSSASDPTWKTSKDAAASALKSPPPANDSQTIATLSETVSPSTVDSPPGGEYALPTPPSMTATVDGNDSTSATRATLPLSTAVANLEDALNQESDSGSIASSRTTESARLRHMQASVDTSSPPKEQARVQSAEKAPTPSPSSLPRRHHQAESVQSVMFDALGSTSPYVTKTPERFDRQSESCSPSIRSPPPREDGAFSSAEHGSPLATIKDSRLLDPDNDDDGDQEFEHSSAYNRRDLDLAFRRGDMSAVTARSDPNSPTKNASQATASRFLRFRRRGGTSSAKSSPSHRNPHDEEEKKSPSTKTNTAVEVLGDGDQSVKTSASMQLAENGAAAEGAAKYTFRKRAARRISRTLPSLLPKTKMSAQALLSTTEGNHSSPATRVLGGERHQREGYAPLEETEIQSSSPAHADIHGAVSPTRSSEGSSGHYQPLQEGQSVVDSELSQRRPNSSILDKVLRRAVGRPSVVGKSAKTASNAEEGSRAFPAGDIVPPPSIRRDLGDEAGSAIKSDSDLTTSSSPPSAGLARGGGGTSTTPSSPPSAGLARGGGGTSTTPTDKTNTAETDAGETPSKSPRTGTSSSSADSGLWDSARFDSLLGAEIVIKVKNGDHSCRKFDHEKATEFYESAVSDILRLHTDMQGKERLEAEKKTPTPDRAPEDLPFDESDAKEKQASAAAKANEQRECENDGSTSSLRAAFFKGVSEILEAAKPAKINASFSEDTTASSETDDTDTNEKDDSCVGAFICRETDSDVSPVMQALSSVLAKLGIAYFRTGQFEESTRAYIEARACLVDPNNEHGGGSTSPPRDDNISDSSSQASLGQSTLASDSLCIDASNHDTSNSAAGQQKRSVMIYELKLNGYILHNLASVFMMVKKLEVAMITYKEALRLKRAHLRTLLDRSHRRNTSDDSDLLQSLTLAEGEDNEQTRATILSVANTVHNIGLLRFRMKDLEKAEEAYVQALSLRVERCGLDSLTVASTLNNLGGLYLEAGRFDYALRSFREVLAIRKKQLGSDHGSVGSALYNIALVYYQRGPYDSSVPVVQEALRIRRATNKENHSEVAETLQLLGLVRTAIGEYDGALQALEEALMMRTAVLGDGDSHLAIMSTRLAVGTAHRNRGDYSLAMTCFESVHTGRSLRLGADHPLTAEALLCIGLVHKDTMECQKAIDTFQAVLRIRKEIYGLESMEVAEVMNHLGMALFNSGIRNSAFDACSESIRILKAKGHSGHILYAKSLKNLGDMHQDRLDFDSAIETYEESLEVRKKWQARNHLDVADTLNNIGNARFKKGDYEAARDSFAEALVIKRKWLDGANMSIVTTLNNLGHSHYKLRNHEKALQAYGESFRQQHKRLSSRVDDPNMEFAAMLLEIRENLKTMDPEGDEIDSLSTELGNIAATLRNIGLVHQERGRTEEALEAYSLTFAARKIQPTCDHAAVAAMAETIGMLHFKSGNNEAALAAFYEALHEKEIVFGPETIDVARTLNNLANVLYSRGSLDEAMHMYNRSLQIKKKRLGERHEEVASTLNNIAHALFTSGRNDESLAMYSDVLKIRIQNSGEHHMSVAIVLSNMGDVHMKNRNWESARECFEQSLDIRKKRHSRNYVENCRVLESIAKVHGKLEAWDKAEGAYRESLNIKKEALGEEHEEVARTIESLALCQMEQGKQEEAVGLLYEAVRMMKSCLGDHHEDVFTSLNKVAYLHKQAGQPELALEVYAEIERLGGEPSRLSASHGI